MILKSLLFLLFSIGAGALFLFLGYKLYKWAFLKIFNIGRDINVASAIVIAALLFALGLLMSASLGPIRSLLTILDSGGDTSFLLIAGYVSLYWLIGFVMAFGINYLGFYLFTRMTTNMDEAAEIRNNNIGVAIVLAAVIVLMVFFAKEGYEMVLHALLPQPELPYIR